MTKWHYTGDVNIEHGGTFYNLDDAQYDYAEAIRVQPCSDAGCQDNAFWVEHMSINFPTSWADLKSVLNCCGIDTYDKADAKTRLHMRVHACLGYGSYDIDMSEVVQIGKHPDPFHRGEAIKPDRVLRSNASLRNYALRVAKQGF